MGFVSAQLQAHKGGVLGILRHEILADAQAPAPVANWAAWETVTDATSSNDALQAAAAAAQRAVADDPDDVRLQDTLATARYRLGDLDGAVQVERQVVGKKDTSVHSSQLARFEWARFHEEGVLRVGALGTATPTIGFVRAKRGGKGGNGFVVDLGDAFPNGVILHAAVLSPDGQRILGQRRVGVGSAHKSVYRFTDHSKPLAALPPRRADPGHPHRYQQEYFQARQVGVAILDDVARGGAVSLKFHPARRRAGRLSWRWVRPSLCV